MNKSFFLSLLFTVSILFASENGTHSVSLSYGLLNTTGASVMAANALVSYFGGDKEDLKDVNLLTMSSFNVAYGYELWEKLETGGILTYSYVGSGYNNHTITFMPKAKINWINESNFRFYSLLAIGTVFLFNSEEFKANTLWHLSLAGFEFGKDTSFFWQFGIGQAGFMAWGVKFKL